MLPLTLCLVGCSFAEAGKTAEAGTQRFHDLFNDGQYAAIYEEAAAEFRAATTQAQLTELLQAVQRKIGKVKSFQQQNINVFTSTNAGTSITVAYVTIFETGQANEVFRWVVIDGKARLVSYNITSPDLITR